MKNTIFTISKMILSVATIPLWFVKMFIGVGHLPDQTTGEIVEVIFRHSMLENVGDLAHPILAYIVMAIAVSAIIVYAYIMTVTGGDSFGAYYGEMRSALSIKLGIAHLVSFVFAVGRAYIRIRRSS